MKRACQRRYLAVMAAAILLAGPARAQSAEAPPYVPTPMELVHAMLDLARVGDGDVLYDLGSGDGRIVLAAAGRGARAVGYENQAPLVALSRARADSLGVNRLAGFRTEDLFSADLSPATVVTLFLSAGFNLRLRPRLLDQLRPGSRIVSHTFHMRDWRPDSTVVLGTGASRATLHLWIVPADLDGFWSLEMEGSPAAVLELRQRFQVGSGAVLHGGRRAPLSALRIRGELVEFSAPLGPGGAPRRFTGRLLGGRLVGVHEDGDGSGSWSAVRFTDPRLAPR